MNDEYIPRATAEKLVTEFPLGTRHKAKVDIAVPLIANGMAPNAVFVQLREKFPDASDREIDGVIKWVVKQNPTASHNGNGNGSYRPNYYAPAAKDKPKRTPTQQCEWWTSGARETESAVAAASPLPLPETKDEAAALVLACLYQESDLLNVVTEFFVDPKKGKATPVGAGETKSREEWILHFRDHGVPQSEAGAWIRINPCCFLGSGKLGSMTDDDVTDFRYLLLESDVLPLPICLALYRRINLPVAAIIMSGGHSAHAWIRMESPNAEKYDQDAAKILSALEPFGFDQGNKNPSRLCRLPGATRVIGAENGGHQSVIWINPNCAKMADDCVTQFEESLKLPAIEEKPLRKITSDAMPRYQELRRNAGRLGVPYGIPQLDYISGGMKPGQTIAVAGKTGGGKSTYGLHLIDTALKTNYGVLLFSLEMDKEEIFDLMVSSRLEISRNKFNHGRFTDYDMRELEEKLPSFSDLPLYIEDTPMMSAEQIRIRTMQLKTANKIGLVVVDYIQFVSPEWTKESREQQVAAISHKLRALARETRLPFVILSQLNDEGAVRESRVIGHNANVLLQIDVDKDQMTIEIKKGRGIPTGDHILTFDRRFARLLPQNYAAIDDDNPRPEKMEQSSRQASMPYKDP